jgi:hypothetical protein
MRPVTKTIVMVVLLMLTGSISAGKEGEYDFRIQNGAYPRRADG